MLILNELVGFGAGESDGGNDSYTQLLLHFDGSNGDTTYTDSSAAARTVTRLGSSTLSTAQAKFGATSLSVSTDGCSVADAASLEPGSGDFAIDFWAYPTQTSTQARAIGKLSGSFSPIMVAVFSGNWIWWASQDGVSFLVNGATIGAATANQWAHIAITRSGGTLRPFVNGTAGTTQAITGSLWDNSAAWNIGNNGNVWTGYIDEVRISIGVPRWTANFTPPTVPYF